MSYSGEIQINFAPVLGSEEITITFPRPQQHKRAHTEKDIILEKIKKKHHRSRLRKQQSIERYSQFAIPRPSRERKNLLSKKEYSVPEVAASKLRSISLTKLLRSYRYFAYPTAIFLLIALGGHMLYSGFNDGKAYLSSTAGALWKPVEESDKISLQSAELERDIHLFPTRVRNTEITEFSYDTLYRNARFAFTDKITVPPAITGNAQADARIREIAQKRGYTLQYTPSGELGNYGSISLQKDAAKAWAKLRGTAETEGISLGLVSGYRSIGMQRTIFMNNFYEASQRTIGRQFTYQEIIDKKADKVINLVLQTSSIPGFSRHHSGYTIDIIDLDSGLPFTRFGETKGFTWISKNNYENAKKFGFIPCYPDEAKNLGPEPESWEYVWIGAEQIGG
ncbi:MAG: M15 family metallopeptidase [Candidatus Dojkabacteria bacterium]